MRRVLAPAHRAWQRRLGVVSTRACASDARRVWRWGATEGGLLAQVEAPETSTEPTLIEDVKGVSSAACGSNHSAFVRQGRVYTYGSNKSNQLGRDDDPNAPGLVEGLENVRQVALGAFHSACVLEDGSLYTWGWGGGFFHGVGALGLGDQDTRTSPSCVELFRKEGMKIKMVTCGAQHTVVLTEDGHLYATGKGDFGRLGRGDTSDEVDFHVIDYFDHTDDSILKPGEPARICKIGAGENFTAAMSEQGELWVWGRNDYGQLGLGEEAMGDMYSAERFPRMVRSLPQEGVEVVDFACGEHHVIALSAEGHLYEWGDRSWLEPHRVLPPQVEDEDFHSIVKVAAGDKFSLALTASGKLYVWGSKISGCLALGPESPKNIVEPTPVSPEVFGHQKLVDIAASKFRCLAISDESQHV
ncbi:E3 ubiquitin-protein ligase HERC2 (HECT domain and RCC1-like domain-containing protein 2) (HECT-type E3 ubiquitin transferase HERC2) [Durusdinium trenchii]|uniref:E3 ubiquitin-protein ligase HERC2 (HECT domain and RCC1-like domain-containing protein 2) (HECT-type E3 ubiquitin transferase HERC2) n=2 Tax=Durusdinium trenchii TaxID=1381693 RepID=A0ABP0N0B7_9DINO